MSASTLSRLTVTKIYSSLCETVDSPFSLKCWKLYETGQHRELAEQKVDPQHYRDPIRFRDDYLVSSYLSKWKELDTGIDREAVALESFANSELKCKDTNVRLRNPLGLKPDVNSIILIAQRKIADLLAPYSYVDAFQNCGWGKGATATIKGDRVSLVRKMDPGRTEFISVSQRALPYAKIILESDPAWFSAFAHAEVLGLYSAVPRLCFKIIRGNRVTTVPKDATKDRTIAAEPTANIYLQLGVGRFFRKVLRKHLGIDLDDQSRNQLYAFLGSKLGIHATIDLRSASDTVCRELVRLLFPYHWFELLDQLRSPEGEVGKGNWVKYEKFSSMGNGFTFELETLIFYALAVATAQHYGHKGRILAYGDDIIYPSTGYQQFSEILVTCGFEVNTKKSYATGPFRESCGRHYFDGVDVTPVYQKEGFYEDRSKGKTPRYLLQEAYRCANRVLRFSLRSGHYLWLDRRFLSLWRTCRKALDLREPKHVIPVDDESDDGLLVPRKELERHFVGTAKHGMIKLPVYSFAPRHQDVSPDEQGTLYAATLRRQGSARGVSRRSTLSERIDCVLGVPEHYKSIKKTFLKKDGTYEPFDITCRIPVGRLGYYVSRRRMYPIGTTDVAWA